MGDNRIIFELIFLWLYLVIGLPLAAQKVCGAEIEKNNYFPDTKALFVRIQVCRENWFDDDLVFDWGDGQADTFPRIVSLNLGDGYLLDTYHGWHTYDSTFSGYVELGILEEEIMETYSNVDYTQGVSFLLRDSMLIYSVEEEPYENHNENQGPRMEPDGIVVYDGGILSKELRMYQYPTEPDTLGIRLFSFPVAGYSEPAPSTELYVEGGILYWDQPLVPGVFAIASRAREMRFTDNPIYPDQWTLVSTITKAFTILVELEGERRVVVVQRKLVVE